MAYNNLHTEIKGCKLIISVSRVKYMNALSKETVLELNDCVLKSQYDKEIKGIIITGKGEKSFVSGADIKEFMGLTQDEAKKLAETGQNTFKTIENSPKPIIAAINGYALGGGCELAMACHLRIASKNAMFGQPEVKLGIIAGYGGTQRLIQYLGKTKATEYHLTGKMFSAEEALKMGLLNYIVEKEDLLKFSENFLDQIIQYSPLAIAAILKSLNSFFDPNAKGFENEINEFGKCFTTEDTREGISAFLEKRKPNFIGS